MKYSIENNGQGVVLIRVYAPSGLAPAFLAFIEQKSRENVPILKTSSPTKNESALIEFKSQAFNLFDAFLKEGLPINSALSKTNFTLKTLGYCNSSYDSVKNILSVSGRLRRKAVK